MNTFIIGSRGSKLALVQANLVAAALRAVHTGFEAHIEVISTKGDHVLDVALSKIGDKGLFVKELETALLDGRIHAAVHSAKDLPSRLPNGLTLAAFLPRADARDALVLRHPSAEPTANPLQGLAHNARVGTSSLRRIAQLKHVRPDVVILDVRGNVDTRLRKLTEGHFDALVLAMAGLSRLGLISSQDETYDDEALVPLHMNGSTLFVQPLLPTLMLPAVAQGALAIECRAEDQETLRLLSPINHTDTQTEAQAERAFLRRIEGGCQVPIAAFARVTSGQVQLTGLVGSIDGAHSLQRDASGPWSAAEQIGTALAEDLLANGAQDILDAARHNDPKPLAGMRVVITREEGRSNSLTARLRKLGAEPILYPVISHAPPDDLGAFDAAMTLLLHDNFDWLVLTSVNAVEAVQAWFAANGARFAIAPSNRVHLAVVGPATAQACQALLGIQPHLMPSTFTAKALAAEMGEMQNRHVLLLNADLARPTLGDALQAAGATIQRVIAYKTVPAADNHIDMNLLMANHAVDAVLFTSGSTVHNFIDRIDPATLSREPHLHIVCIGPSTAAAARANGLQPTAIAREASDDGLIDALVESWGARSTSD